MKLFFSTILASIICVLLLSNCTDDSPNEPSGGVDDELVKYDPVPIVKNNPTKTYMHYMTWFETNESSADKQWGYHWKMNNKNPNNVDANGKREIAAHYYPLIGPYHSGDKDVIEYHLLLMKYAGVDGILIDWYGTFDLYDFATIKENTEQVIDLLDKVGIKYAMVYEDRFLKNIVDAGLATTKEDAAKKDLQHLQNKHFSNVNYIKVNSKPLLLNFGPITLKKAEEWTNVFSALNTKPTFLTLWNQSNEAGENASGEYAWVYKNNSYLTDFYTSKLPNLTVAFGSAYPGFKDFYKEGGTTTNIGWTIEHNNGQTLNETLQLAKNNNVDYLQLITWNDFGEGTMFEPTLEFKYNYLNKIKSFTNVQNTGSYFEDIYQLFLLRKDKKGNAVIQKKLDQAFYYFVSLQAEKAREILDTLK